MCEGRRSTGHMGRPINQVREISWRKWSIIPEAAAVKREELKLLIGSHHIDVVFIGSYTRRRRRNGEKEGSAKIN